MANENKSEPATTQKCHTAICEPGSNKGTMRNRDSPASSLEITECKPRGQYSPPAPSFFSLVCLPCCLVSWLVLVCPAGVVFSCVFLFAWCVWCFFVLFVRLLAFVGFASRHTGQVRSCILLSPVRLRPYS